MSVRSVRCRVWVGALALAACASRGEFEQMQSDVALLKAESARRDSAEAAQLGEALRMQRALRDSLAMSRRGVSELRGDLGTDLYNIQQQLVQLQELTGQSQQRLTELRARLEAREAQMAATTPAPDTTRPPVAGAAAAAPADEMYEASLMQLRRGSTATARLGLRELLRLYPTSERAPDALYFIGQSFAAESPDSAAAYYRQAVDQYPNSPRASAALYNLGLLAERRKDAASARQAYERVAAQYPQSDEAALARDRLKALGR